MELLISAANSNFAAAVAIPRSSGFHTLAKTKDLMAVPPSTGIAAVAKHTLIAVLAKLYNTRALPGATVTVEMVVGVLSSPAASMIAIFSIDTAPSRLIVFGSLLPLSNSRTLSAVMALPTPKVI